jgi:transcriptional regulator with XRE-family HTH domain
MKEAAKQTNQKMAKYLKQIRQNEAFTMRALAEIVGTPHSFVGKIEQQNRRLDVGEFIEYCRAMNQDPLVVLAAVIKL